MLVVNAARAVLCSFLDHLCVWPPLQMSHQALHFRGIFWSGYQNSPRIITGALNSKHTSYTVELISLSSCQVTQLDCRKNGFNRIQIYISFIGGHSSMFGETFIYSEDVCNVKCHCSRKVALILFIWYHQQKMKRHVSRHKLLVIFWCSTCSSYLCGWEPGLLYIQGVPF
jgi:hypothetical protein